MREEQQQRAPGRELEAGAVRHEERGGDDEQEHEEEQRAPVAPGAGHRHREHEPVDQHQQRHERPVERGQPPAHEPGDHDHQRVAERQGDQRDVEVAGERGDDRQRHRDDEADALQHEEPVRDRLDLTGAGASHVTCVAASVSWASTAGVGDPAAEGSAPLGGVGAGEAEPASNPVAPVVADPPPTVGVVAPCGVDVSPVGFGAAEVGSDVALGDPGSTRTDLACQATPEVITAWGRTMGPPGSGESPEQPAERAFTQREYTATDSEICHRGRRNQGKMRHKGRTGLRSNPDESDGEESGSMTVEVPDVAPEDAVELVEAGALLLDVREPDEWQAGHAPGAMHVPMREIPARVEDLSTDRRIVAICRSGARSRTVAEALVGAGFDVVNVGGGMRAWEAADLPIETDDGSPGSVI